MPQHQTIAKDKLEELIGLKRAYIESRDKLPPVGDELGTMLPRDTEALIEHENARRGLPEYDAVNEFLRSLSGPQLQYLEAVAFYGRGDGYGSFAEALRDARAAAGYEEIEYTFGLVAESDYLEEGFEKMNRKREI